MQYRHILLSCVLGTLAQSCAPSGPPATGLQKINHIIVMYLENHSFDNLYGEFPGANGLRNAADSNTLQVDSVWEGATIRSSLPRPDATKGYVKYLRNHWFFMDSMNWEPLDAHTPFDITHRFNEEQVQIRGIHHAMDAYVPVSSGMGFAMGAYHTAGLPLADSLMVPNNHWVLMDNFFHSAFGGSFLNHIYFIAADAPVDTSAPDSVTIVTSKNGLPVPDSSHHSSNQVYAQKHWVVNTAFSTQGPPVTLRETGGATYRVPIQTMKTIGDRLDEAHHTWAWYSGGWDEAMKGTIDSNQEFQYHHQPFVYFQNYNKWLKAGNLLDETRFIEQASKDSLPEVSFVKPVGINNEHPNYADVMTGERHVASLIHDIEQGSKHGDYAIIITYDENGGFWDHVIPPKIDSLGPGTRVPAIMISPFAKQHYIDHTQAESVSILRFIEQRFDLPPLHERDKKAYDLMGAFEF